MFHQSFGFSIFIHGRSVIFNAKGGYWVGGGIYVHMKTALRVQLCSMMLLIWVFILLPHNDMHYANSVHPHTPNATTSTTQSTGNWQLLLLTEVSGIIRGTIVLAACWVHATQTNRNCRKPLPNYIYI